MGSLVIWKSENQQSRKHATQNSPERNRVLSKASERSWVVGKNIPAPWARPVQNIGKVLISRENIPSLVWNDFLTCVSMCPKQTASCPYVWRICVTRSILCYVPSNFKALVNQCRNVQHSQTLLAMQLTGLHFLENLDLILFWKIHLRDVFQTSGYNNSPSERSTLAQPSWDSL